MEKRVRIVIYLLLFLGFGKVAQAQIYPVQVTAQLAPPFSGYLSDYNTPGNQNLKLLVLFSDFTKPSYSIKLKIKISGQGITIQSKNQFYSQAFSVQPGIPLELSGSDLSELLNTNNLDFSGISIKDYEEKKTLPEGFYNICFIAYDNNNPTQIQVSNESCAAGWMVLSDPPFLNLPFCGSTIETIDPQNIFFQWTPMNLTSPNSAMNTVYDFELYEIKPGTQSPGNIVQTLPPIYKTTTPLVSVNYGMTEPQLYPNMQYVWRVRARDQSGRDLFKNQGYSQLCTFTYGNKFSQIDSNSLRLNLQGAALSYRMIKYTWDTLSIFSSYELQYRKQGGENWFPVYLAGNKKQVIDLEPQTTYEARVKGVAEEGEGPWSNVVTITTPPKAIVVCGQSSTPPSMDNFQPLKFGKPGQVWNVGQFEMLVTRLENPDDPSGSYSGYGKIEIPFLLGANFTGKFKDILMNEEMTMVQGEVTIVSDGVDGGGIINLDSVFNVIDGWFSDFEKTGDDTTLVNKISDFKVDYCASKPDDDMPLICSIDNSQIYALTKSKDGLNTLKDYMKATVGSSSIAKCDPFKVPVDLKLLADQAIECGNEVDDKAEAFSDKDFAMLCVDQRVNLIKCISSGTAVPTADEKTILRLIKTTPSSQIKALLERLEANESELLLKLISAISDVGDDNYSEMMFTLVDLFQKQNTSAAVETIYWGVLNQSDYYEGANVNATFQDNGKLLLQGVYTCKTQNTKNMWGPFYEKLDRPNVSPFTPVVFTFISVPHLWEEGNRYKVGESYVVPAIFVYFIRDKVMKGIMQKSFGDGLNLLMPGQALKEIKVARGLWKAFAVIVAASNAGSFILNTPTIASQIMETQEGREFLFWYNRCTAIANLVYISPFAYKFSVNMVKAYPAVRDRLKTMLTKNEFDEIEKVIEEVGETSITVSNEVNAVTHIVEQDVIALQAVKPAVRASGVAINNVKNLVNEGKALVLRPMKNSPLAQKVDEYIAAYTSKNTTLQGQIGEEIAELMAKEVNATGDVLNIKINNSGHGFDVLSFTPNKQVPTSVRVLEAKPFTGTSVELPVTNNGVQMSEEWLRAKIKDMQFHSDPNIQQIGDNLQKLLKQNKLERFVVTVDKDLKQVIIIKLDTF